MLEKEKKDQDEARKKHGLTSWLKLKLLGKEKETSPVDSQFLADLSDITTVGRYEIIGKLGQGSMGVVFLGRDPYINRHVAIKVSRKQFSARFEREARAIAQLNHPHICTLYDVGPNYLVMELVEGAPLSARLQKGALPLAKSRIAGM